MKITPYIKPSKFTKNGITNYLKLHNITADYKEIISKFVLLKGKTKIKKLVDKENYITNNFDEFKKYCKSIKL